MQRWFVLGMTLVVALMLAACTANESAGEKEKDDGGEAVEETETEEKVLYMNNGDEPTSLNPPVGFNAVSWNMLNNLMEGLTRLGEDDTPQPAIDRKSTRLNSSHV